MTHDQDKQIDDALMQMFIQAHAQFGDAVRGYWLNESGLCPGCRRKVDVMKWKGKDALSLNADIYRQKGILIGYFLCNRCANKVFRDAKRNPGQETSLHATIETNLINAYKAYKNSLN